MTDHIAALRMAELAEELRLLGRSCTPRPAPVTKDAPPDWVTLMIEDDTRRERADYDA